MTPRRGESLEGGAEAPGTFLPILRVSPGGQGWSGAMVRRALSPQGAQAGWRPEDRAGRRAPRSCQAGVRTGALGAGERTWFLPLDPLSHCQVELEGRLVEGPQKGGERRSGGGREAEEDRCRGGAPPDEGGGGRGAALVHASFSRQHGRKGSHWSPPSSEERVDRSAWWPLLGTSGLGSPGARLVGPRNPAPLRR